VTDRLAALCDRIEVDDLVTAYANALDDRDWDAFRDLFTPHATIDFTAAFGRAGRRDEIVDWLTGQVTRAFVPEIQHLIVNRSIAVRGDTASGRLDFFNPDVVDQGDGTRTLMMHGGRYRFEAVRTGDGWRFTRWIGSVVWSHAGDLLVFELPEE
jgi:hypothetical protein